MFLSTLLCCVSCCVSISVTLRRKGWKKGVVAGITIKAVMCCVFVGNRLVKKCGPKPQELCTPCEPNRFTMSQIEPMCQPCTQCVGMLRDPPVQTFGNKLKFKKLPDFFIFLCMSRCSSSGEGMYAHTGHNMRL